jgi:phosphoribosyl 1,2-cyclic phosphodiesterase
MRFASLGSGSRGNATLIASGSTLVMVDCGFSCRETERRLARLGCSAAQLAAILVTHEHGDHIRGVCALARQYDLPVWLSAGTQLMLRDEVLPEIHCLDGQTGICLGDLGIQPFTVPHDAREPCQFVFTDGKHRFGLLTDTGRITAHILDCLDKCDALMLECNHDEAMLAGSSYSASLKARVGGPLGHLSNAQAAGLLESIDATRLQHVVAAHLSEKNNHPDLARAALAGSLGCAPDWIAVAGQEDGLAWRALS